MDCMPQLHLAAIHAEPGYRGDTPGLGVLCRDGDLLAGAGLLRNSIGQRSAYAIAGWQPLRLGPVRIGAVAGAINGYRYRDGAAMPFAAGVVSVPAGRAEIHLTVIPSSPVSPATLGLSLSWRL